jgi:small basic protein
MNKLSVFRLVSTVIAGLAIGVIITAIVNLVVPGTNLTWTLIAVCLSSVLSGVAGVILGAGQKQKKQTP